VDTDYPRVPRSIMNANQDEDESPIAMEIKGTLPYDLQGHVFIVAPSGLPFEDKSAFLNGNGMIYRLDFDRPGEVRLQRKLANSPDYLADTATQNNELLKFQNYGIVRFSWLLGSRNQLNTAFLPMKFSGEQNERLLVTYDAGRPYEIDTKTLKTVTPVGKLEEWEAEVTEPKHPLPLILSTAHPIFDVHKSQMFTVNYGRSILNLLGIIVKGTEAIVSAIKTNKNLIDRERQKPISIFSRLELLLRIACNLKNPDRNFVILMRWDGASGLKKWKLVKSDNSPVKLSQSIHQIGLTEDYVVLMDTAFVTGIEQVVNNFPDLPILDERRLFARRPSPNSILYIVRRDDLKEDRPTVVAHQVTIPREAAHFLVDYENPNNKITLHIAHICAWDIAEWLRRADKFPKENSLVPSDLLGTQQGQMDISQMGRHIIDVNKLGESEPLIESTFMSHSICTWGPGLCTYSPSLGMTPNKLDNIYWVSFGLWKELTIQFMYDMYKNYKYRQVPLDKLLKLAEQGVPSCLYRLHTPSMTIPDYYQCEKGCLLLSPQFVPRLNNEESSTNGYIVCTAFTPERDEIWIFDAEKLNQGPICKLSHPTLNIGLSLHTAWLNNISDRQASYKIPVKQDYQSLLNNWLEFIDTLKTLKEEDKHQIKKEIKELFEREIYPYCESDIMSA